MLDQESHDFLNTMASLTDQGGVERTPVVRRSEVDQIRQLIGSGPDVYRSEDRTLRSGLEPLVVRIISPSPTPSGVIVYLHGGGWVVGKIDEWDTFARTLAWASNCTVVLVEYRLAPEHPYPAAVNDTLAAVSWVGDNLEEIAGARVPLIVAGDSAGGNLAAVVALDARESGPELSAQILIYPVVDADFERPSYVDPDNQQGLSKEDMEWYWEQYVPDATLRLSPDVAPLWAADLRGLPPTILLTAEHDVLRDEGEAYVELLLSAGVVVRHRRFSQQMHGFLTLTNVLAESAVGVDFIVAALRDTIPDFD